MQYDVNTVEDYLTAIPENRRAAIEKLRGVILANLPEGFEEQIAYGMISYVVPLSRYPQGYHAGQGEPLPFISLASQKNHIALYHMGIYGDPVVLDWFTDEYAHRVPTKLDMGKSCIRFTNPDRIPYDLVAELCRKITVEAFISAYESAIQRK